MARPHPLASDRLRLPQDPRGALRRSRSEAHRPRLTKTSALAGFLAAVLLLAVGEAEARRTAESKYPLYDRAKTLVDALQSGDPNALNEIRELYESVRGGSSRDELLALQKCTEKLAFALGEDPARIDERRALFEEGHEAAIRTNRSTTRAYFTTELAPLYIQQGEMHRAREILEGAKDAVRPDHVTVPALCRMLAQLTLLHGEFDVTLALLELGESRLVDGNDWHAHERALVHGVRGEAYKEMGVIDEAVRWFDAERDAVDRITATKRREGARKIAALHRASLFLALDAWQRVVDEIGDDVEHYPEGSLQRAELGLSLAIALSHLERIDPSRPKRAASLLREIHETAPLAWARDAAILRLADLEIREGRPDAAQRLLEEPVSDETLSQRAVRALLELRLTQTDRAEKLAALERSVLAMADQWREIEPREGGLGFLEMVLPEDVIVELLLETHREFPGTEGATRAFDLMLETQSVGTLARRLGAPRLDMKAARNKVLTAGEAILVYLTGTDRSAVLCLTADHVDVAILEPRHLLRERVAGVIEWLALPPTQISEATRIERTRQLDRQLDELSSRLFPDAIRSRLVEAEAVTIAVPDSLGYLPFECLTLPGHDRTLGLERAIAYLPSLHVGAALVERPPLPLEPADSFALDARFVLAPERSDSLEDSIARLPRLPFTEQDVTDLCRAYHQDRVEVLRGTQANLGELSRSDRASTPLLHFVVHGVSQPDREHRAGLLLSPNPHAAVPDDGVAWAEDLRGISWPWLTFLASCGADQAPERRGDSAAASLTGLVLEGGAQCVILPYLSIGYGAAVELSVHFHESLARGATPAGALLAARRALAATDAYSDLRDTSLVHAWGLAHRPVFAARHAPESPGTTRREPHDTRAILRWVGSIVGGLLLVAGSVHWIRSRP